MARRKQGGGSNRSLITLQADWSGGSHQDKPRDQIPANAAWLLTDVFPDGNFETGSGFPLRSRNGWVRSCAAMSASSATSSSARSVGYAAFSTTAGGSTARILGVDNNGILFKWTPAATAASPGSDGSATQVGTMFTGAPVQPPVFYRNYAYFLAPDNNTGYRYDNTTLSVISGTPPKGKVGCVFKDHLVLAHAPDGTGEARVWFSDAGDPTTWNTAADGQWLDCSGPVNAIVTFQNMILAFQDGFTERLRGDVIPGVLNSDFVREPLFPLGTRSASSVAVSKEGVIFANADGVFMSDGLQAYDLTKLAGMSEYWRETLKPAGANVNVSGAVYKDWYVFSVATTPYLSGAINLTRHQFVRFSNLQARMMVTTPQTAYASNPPRLLMAEATAPNISDIGVMLDEVSAYTNVDGNGTLVAPSVDTRYYQPSDMNPKRWRSLYLTGGGDVPAAGTTIKYSDTPHVEPATTLTSTHTLAGAPTRSRVNLGKASRGFSFRVTPAFSASATSTTGFHLDAIEAEVTPLYGRRR